MWNSVVKSCFWSGPKQIGPVPTNLDVSKTIWTYRKTRHKYVTLKSTYVPTKEVSCWTWAQNPYICCSPGKCRLQCLQAKKRAKSDKRKFTLFEALGDSVFPCTEKLHKSSGFLRRPEYLTKSPTWIWRLLSQIYLVFSLNFWTRPI